MAFTPGSIANQTAKPKATTGGFVPGSISSKVVAPRTTGGFVPGSISGSVGGKADTKSSNGLYLLAVKNGLKDRADSILRAQQGEQTNRFFSGGFISDTLDVLNALQYGVVGVLKGKTFVSGVRDRSSFSDKDALGDKGLPGVIAGIALDIAFDPLTYIAPATVVRKIPFLSKAVGATKNFLIGEKVLRGIDTGKTFATAEEAAKAGERTFETLEGGTRAGRYLTEKLAYRLGKDPVFMAASERATKNAAITTQKVVNLGKTVANITPDVAAKIVKVVDDQGRLGRESLKVLSKILKPDEFVSVAKLYKTIDDLGKEAVDLGLLSKKKFEENYGEYLKNAYLEFEQQTGKKLPLGFASTGIKGIKSRVDELSEARKADQIKNPAYLLMKSAIDLTRDVENAKLFREVAKKFGTDVAQPGFTQISKTVRTGELGGKFVPNHMADYLNEIIQPSSDTFGKWLIGNFKFAKVVMNPGTHARNIASNEILNYWKLGMNPLDPRTWAAKKEALTEIAKGGGKWTDEARPLGYNLDTFASAELKGILDAPEFQTAMGKAGSNWKKVKNKLGDLYQAEENQAKLTAYIYQRKVAKLSPEEAWKAAESATFNYAQVTPFIRKLRTSLWGMPFITFSYKATPLAIETMLKHPNRISVIGKIKKGIENLSDLEETDRERASEPAWVRDGFYIKLPGKDEYGRSKYFDLTYILPFGDLVSGSLLERGMKTETGTKESAGEAILRKNPVTQLIMELGKNRNFYGNKIWKDSDPGFKQSADIFNHIVKTYSPPPLAEQLPNGYDAKTGERDWRGIAGATEADTENQKRNLTQEVFRNFGIKIQPIDADIQETYQEWNKKKALETLLKESGVLKGLEINYVPKNE